MTLIFFRCLGVQLLMVTIDGRKCNSDLGCKELLDGDMISIPSYNGRFRVEIYNYDKPSYIPYVY